MATTPTEKDPAVTTLPAIPVGDDLSTVDKIITMAKDYATGAIKGLTTDLAGTPVDLMNLLVSPATRALGIYSDKPVGGSAWFREKAGVAPEDSNLRETVGNLLTPGGAAHAMIVGASRAGRDVKDASKLMNELVAEGKSVQEASGRTFAQTGVYVDKTDDFKTVISDANVKFKPNAFRTTRYQGELPVLKTSDALENVIDAPEIFKLYPKLKKIGITSQDGAQIDSAVYNGGAIFPWIGIGPASSQEQLRKTLLHEIQHGIQDIEKFAYKGSNPQAERKFSDTAAKALEEKRSQIQNLLKRKDLASDPKLQEEINSKVTGYNTLRDRFELDRQNAYPRYRNNPGEQEATFTESTANLSQEEAGKRVLDLILSGKTPQSWDLKPLSTTVRTK